MRMKKSQWQDVIDLNLTGVFLCIQVNMFSIRVCLKFLFSLRKHFLFYDIIIEMSLFEGLVSAFKDLCIKFFFKNPV